jgi:hypothetical protein
MKPALDEAWECIALHESHVGFDQAFNPDCLGLAAEIAVILDRREREARVEELRWVSSDSTVSYEQIESRIRDLEAQK